MDTPRLPFSKIKTAEDLALILNDARRQGKRIAHCHGVFDFVHLGHIRYFRYAKERADIIYVGVIADRFVRKGANRPHHPQDLRMEWLASLAEVDYVILNEEEGPWRLIHQLKPDFYLKSESDKEKLNDPHHGIRQDMAAVEDVGGSFLFVPEDIKIHSTDIFRQFGME